jgi:hypothetical protein
MLIEQFTEKYLKKVIKKLIGNNEIEDALKRLDRLTQEEARMVSAQLLKISTAINSGVGEIADHVLVVDDSVVGVDERVAGVDERVAGVDERVVGVDERVAGVADGVNRIERSWFPNRIHAGHAGSTILTGDQLQQNLRRWLSPQDPSTNHNIACNAHHKGTANWFFEGRTYKEWKSTSPESLLWVHGKRVPCPILPPDST